MTAGPGVDREAPAAIPLRAYIDLATGAAATEEEVVGERVVVVEPDDTPAA